MTNQSRPTKPRKPKPVKAWAYFDGAQEQPHIRIDLAGPAQRRALAAQLNFVERAGGCPKGYFAAPVLITPTHPKRRKRK